uniref:Uncharacterized protein n=1 Tax=Lotharella globosa TaxID=91324 RepID=A0A7S4DRN1_9EUKA
MEKALRMEVGLTKGGYSDRATLTWRRTIPNCPTLKRQRWLKNKNKPGFLGALCVTLSQYGFGSYATHVQEVVRGGFLWVVHVGSMRGTMRSGARAARGSGRISSGCMVVCSQHYCAMHAMTHMMNTAC